VLLVSGSGFSTADTFDPQTKTQVFISLTGFGSGAPKFNLRQISG
jgi:hypothetical protein